MMKFNFMKNQVFFFEKSPCKFKQSTSHFPSPHQNQAKLTLNEIEEIACHTHVPPNLTMLALVFCNCICIQFSSISSHCDFQCDRRRSGKCQCGLALTQPTRKPYASAACAGLARDRPGAPIQSLHMYPVAFRLYHGASAGTRATHTCQPRQHHFGHSDKHDCTIPIFISSVLVNAFSAHPLINT
jgi:hypothetical protein